MRNDLRLAAKIAVNLDGKSGLWTDAQAGNPLLKGIPDFLIEEASAEEEELLGEY